LEKTPIDVRFQWSWVQQLLVAIGGTIGSFTWSDCGFGL
jgi:hypothetical protein